MSHRVERVAEIIRSEISDLLLRGGIHDPRVTGLVTVTEVVLSSDLKVARVYVSVVGGEEHQMRALQGLHSAAGFVRREVTRRIQMRVSPEIRFYLDHSIERGARVLALMRELGLRDHEGGPEKEG